MAIGARRPVTLLLLDAQSALVMSQRELGYAVGSSHRTASRWAAGQSTPGGHSLRKLAALLYPVDRDLAEEAAAHIGQTLVSLGIEAPPPPPVPASPAVRPEDLVDVLVLTAVEMTGGAPASMRSMLHAVFKRGREVGLTVEAAEKALQAVLARPVVEKSVPQGG
jgi:transcriptional regulator with XRE-family HTH domain